MREEKDSLGSVQVPDDHHWGAQTERSLQNFSIGHQKMPYEVILALACVKKGCARVNARLGILDIKKAKAIEDCADEILSGKWQGEFPLKVWQTGSGTQTNMNVNEVMAHLTGLHPNDEVNLSQSSNDVFPAAMHMACVKKLQEDLVPAVVYLKEALQSKEKAFSSIIKVGRTHLMDAVPLTLGQEFSGYVAQLEWALSALKDSLPALLELPLGGTAVGTGLNAPKDFGRYVTQEIALLTGYPFVEAKNKFQALGGHEACVALSSALKMLAVSLLKIVNDIRWMGSGPRAGFSELFLPVNEPGSSIMPGKVNPTQCEALAMVCAEVFGNDVTISFSASQGNFELNVYKPVIIFKLLESLSLLSEGCRSFASKCVVGLEANHKKIELFLNSSLMLATALNKTIGYDKASKIVQKAYKEEKTLKEAALELKFLSEDEFDKIVDPFSMV